MIVIEFYECANYRGSLQVKEENGVFFWRVDCDVEELPWFEIPEYLGKALFEYHTTDPDRNEAVSDETRDDIR